MPQVKLNTLMAGPDGVFNPGELVEVSKIAAEQLCSGGYAVLVEMKPKEPDKKPMRTLRPTTR